MVSVEQIAAGGTGEDRKEIERWANVLGPVGEYAKHFGSMAIGAAFGALGAVILRQDAAEGAAFGAIVGLVVHPRELKPEEGFTPRPRPFDPF